MAALSGDGKLKTMYEDSDAYSKFAEEVFSDLAKRKLAKRLFLAFTYGMSLGNIMKVVAEQKGDVERAESFFNQFEKLYSWKQSIEKNFFEEGKVTSLLGNNLFRLGVGPLTSKEKRSCVNHVVQGTGSLIFKRALLELSKKPEISILIPMHDAVLVEVPKQYDKNILVILFQDTMNGVLNNNVSAKASLDTFTN